MHHHRYLMLACILVAFLVLYQKKEGMARYTTEESLQLEKAEEDAINYYNSTGTLVGYPVALLDKDGKVEIMLKYAGFKNKDRLYGKSMIISDLQGVHVRPGYKLLVFDGIIGKFADSERQNRKLKRAVFKAGLHKDLGQWSGINKSIIVAKDKPSP